MGRSYWFECPKCNYRAKVSGGTDRGLNLGVQTISCRECRELFDAVTRIRVPDDTPLNSWRLGFQIRGRSFARNLRPPTFPAAMNRLAYHGVPRYKWLQFRLQCPVSAVHRVEVWNDPGKCPKCGTYLEKNAIPYRIWE